jgi:hypothetical protein
MSAIDNDNRSRHSGFLAQLTSIAIQVAQAVYAEDPAAQDHAIRLRLAKMVIASPASMAARLGPYVAAAPAIAAVPPTEPEPGNGLDYMVADESLISTAVTAQWTMLANSVSV